MREKRTKEQKKRRALRTLALVWAFAALAFGLCMIAGQIGFNANLRYAGKRWDIATRYTYTRNDDGYTTFTADKEFKILQLTDTHLGGGFISIEYDRRAITAVKRLVVETAPDLVVATGDLVYPMPVQTGSVDNLSEVVLFAEMMESLNVPYAVTLGNHDSEPYSYHSRAEIARYLETLENCLFLSGEENAEGYGNYVIDIANAEGKIFESLFFFDSHALLSGCLLGAYDKIRDSQVDWYRREIEKLNLRSQNAKSLAFMHVPPREYKYAWEEYIERGETENVKYFYGGVGEKGGAISCSKFDSGIFEAMTELDSTKGIFVGHDHKNDFSVEYKGIRLTFGKSIDFVAYPGISRETGQRGGTLITIDQSGGFTCERVPYFEEKNR